MEQNLKYAVGIDISKDSFHACISVINMIQKVTIKASHSFFNTPTGFNELLIWVKKYHKESALPLVYLMEATGVYYEQLAWFLYHQDAYVSVILPNKAKKYLEGLGQKSKTDKKDSIGLARMAAEQNHTAWKPFSAKIQQLRALTRHSQALNEQKTVANNQVHAIEHSQYQSKMVLKQLNSFIKLIDKQLDEIHKAIIETIQQDEQLNNKVNNILHIKGLGILTIATIIAETDGFALFENQRQLTSFAGYDVIENESGKHIGKTKISKKGNHRIRRALFMPAFNVVKYQQTPFFTLFERVFERTKLKMKAYVAVQRKLLVLIFSLWKNNQKYDQNYQYKQVAPTSGATQNEVLNEVLLLM
jgi:transposase